MGEIARSTLTKYNTVRNKVAEYINQKYERDDLPVTSVSYDFLEDVHCFLVFEQKLTHNTAVTYIEFIEKIFRLAVKYHIINEKQKPPYFYRKREITSTDYLTIEEIDNLEELRGNPEVNNELLLLFLFSCYTGVTDTEIVHINTEDIVEGDSEEDLWLVGEGVEPWELRYVPLFVEVEDIIDMFTKKKSRSGFRIFISCRA